MIECKKLVKKYGDRNVVDGITFKINNGEVFAILGSNGAGKTTTIKMILGLTKKTSGDIFWEKKQRVGYSPERPNFYGMLTGFEHLKYYCELQKIPRKDIKTEILRVMDLIGLENNKTKIKGYSKGMRQRLSIAQSLLGNPEILILDEPTSDLDVIGRNVVMDLIIDLKRRGKTIIINSHILNDIERTCDRGIIMDKGSTVFEWEKGKTSKSLDEIFIERVGRYEHS
ncbi:ABC transporter ATP-binding protein [Miniphocaeibacter massiliensis]|uniref:ABC transporter ATP-binding protein n=1 Tax=Miniphocaeibacter massiliensis TaxID=2041841 RepID=UPI000C1C26F1|nr:ABC transporter ATP-binding protein [Miniphocaeibacter massiliensis]